MLKKTDAERLRLKQGDITRERADGIGNAANSGLRGGGGVDGAIHRAGGPSIMEECRRIGGCPAGSAVMTGAGRLAAKKVIHMVGPVWRGGGAGEPALLASCYRTALGLARDAGLAGVVFPSVSTGVYGYPVDAAAETALRTILEFLAENDLPETVTMVLFDADTLAAYQKALAALPDG